MFDSFSVVLREIAELLLIGESLRLCLRQRCQLELLGKVSLGLVLGVFAGVGVAAWTASQSIATEMYAAIGVAFSLCVLLLACGMLATADVIRNRVHDVIDAWIDLSAGPGLVTGFAFLVGLRETLETTVFLDSLLRQNVRGSEVIQGAFLGTVAAGLIATAYLSIKVRARLLAVFRLSTLAISLLFVKIFVAEAGELMNDLMQGNDEWLAVSQMFLPGGRWYAPLCAALMVGPIVVLARGWWRQIVID